MIIGSYSVIRSAGPDDAEAFRAAFESGPVGALLDQLRESFVPTATEVREMLSSTRNAFGAVNAVEDPQGRVRGFCALNGSPLDANIAQFALIFFDPDDFAAPIAEEVGLYLRDEAFGRKRFHKVMAQCLDHERAQRDFLLRNGFVSDGLQREILYSGGRWYNLESFTLFHRNVARSHVSFAAVGAGENGGGPRP